MKDFFNKDLSVGDDVFFPAYMDIPLAKGKVIHDKVVVRIDGESMDRVRGEKCVLRIEG